MCTRLGRTASSNVVTRKAEVCLIWTDSQPERRWVVTVVDIGQRRQRRIEGHQLKHANHSQITVFCVYLFESPAARSNSAVGINGGEVVYPTLLRVDVRLCI
jgi:hypothetical protein